MKKRLLSLVLVVFMVIAVLSSCVMSEIKYDYDMTQYVSLAQINGTTIDVERDILQLSIDQQILQSATTSYKIKKGDNVCVNIKYYELVYLDEESKVDQKGDEITAITEENLWITNIGEGSYSSEIEGKIIGNQLNSTQTRSMTLKADGTGGIPSDFTDPKYEPYFGQPAYVEFTVINKPVVAGNIVGVDYTGYFCDADGNIKVVDGEEQKFDSGSSVFYPGSKLAIDDVEENLIGANFNEEKTFKAKFPDNYSSEELRGQDVIFKMKVVEMFETPIYNLDFIKNTFGNYESIEAFETASMNSFALELFHEKLLSESTILKYPDDEYKMIKKELAENDAAFSSSYGMGLEEYLKGRGTTLDSYIKDVMMHDEMIMYAYAKSLGFNPSETDLNNAKTYLISYYTYQYMQQNSSLTSDAATTLATQYVENKLGEMYIWEQAMYTFLSEKMPSMYTINVKDATYESITNVLNGRKAPAADGEAAGQE